MSNFEHVSVLPEETLAVLKPQDGELAIDCTLGGAGHSTLLLEAANIKLLGLDCDDNALMAASQKLQAYKDRVDLRRMNFREINTLTRDPEWSQVDMILMDIGVSSHHLDEASRGFSYRFDGPLDMRMDRRLKLTASQVLNTYDDVALYRMFRYYGELKEAKRLTQAVIEQREIRLFSKTSELKELAEKVIRGRRKGPPAATLVFQALRIEVNDELGALRAGLEAAFSLLKPGGRLAVICFHSLEDRIVKKYFNSLLGACTCPPAMPICTCGVVKQAELLTKKPLIAGEGEKTGNSRSACAKLRGMIKI